MINGVDEVRAVSADRASNFTNHINFAKGTLFLDNSSGTASGLDGALGGSGEGVGLDIESLVQFATAENLDSVVGRDETVLAEDLEVEVDDVLGLGNSVKEVDIDTDVLNTVAVFEAEFGEATIDGHLTTLETDFLMITRTSLCTLVTTGSRAALAGASTATDALGVLDRTLCRFEII